MPETNSNSSGTTTSSGAADPVVVGIGASAGGLEALRDMLSRAHGPTGMCFVVVQHLDPTHESMLAQLLDRHTQLEVLQSEGGEKIAAEKVYIIPPGHGLAIRDDVLELTDFTQPRGLRRPIDDFFLSLASDQQVNAACVILSGTGADGTTGLRAVKENGGVCVVQQPETARYDGMPLSAVGTGLVDFVRPPGEILECLSTFFSRRGGEGGAHDAAESVADHVDDLCRVLRTAIGHDFSGYKRSTLVRRVERRMHVLGIDTARAYLSRVRGDGNECEALFRDLLINVTRFFRDPDAFETLRTQAIEPLMRGRQPDEDVRVWIPGCSSGEEAYSIAMLFAETARQMEQPFAVQIFATDIDEQMLQIAREGTYPAAALADIPLPLRERYTMPHAERFTVTTQIRDAIRFSNHSLVKDPPFSRIDLVSCRNLLIYFDDRLQQSVMPLLHYALRPGGLLFLGPSESVGRFDHLFPVLDQQARLFERSPGAPVYPIDLPGNRRHVEPRRVDRGERSGGVADESAAVRRVIDRYAPPTVVLDQDAGIVSAYGRLSRYFDFPVTRAGGSSAITLARPGLRAVIGPLLRQARDGKRRAVARDIEVTTEFGVQPVEIVCDPLPDGTALLVFLETAPFRKEDVTDLEELESDDDHVEALEDELRLTRHRLRSTVEELETANEELKSSNEEMMSMNEELQSTNEELSTVNDELKSKVEQLTVANSDLRNFFESTSLAVVVLDSELKVRNFTEAATSIFPLQPVDRGRPLADVSSRLENAAYLEDARKVIAGETPPQRRVMTRDGGKTLSMRVLPYKKQNGTVDGVTLVLADITDALSMERDLASERERLDLAIKAAGIGIWEYFPESGGTRLDGAEQELLHASAADEPLDSILSRVDPEDRAHLEEALRHAVANDGDFEATFRIRGPNGARRWIKGFGRLVAGSQPKRLVGVSIDVTPEYSLAETRELMIREMNHRVKNLFAIMAGMVTVGARLHSDVTVFARDLRERVSALGRAHSLASTSGGREEISLDELVRAAIEPYADHADIAVDGPPAHIRRDYISPLALILHEWATNSVKYGALGTKGGRLSVAWQPDKQGLSLRWLEELDGDPDVMDDIGFGTRLVETSVRQMEAELDRTIDGRSLKLTIKLPEGVVTHG